MTYSSLVLNLPKDDARERIVRNVASVNVSEDESGQYVFRTPSGFHLAVLSDHALDGGESGSKLRYRTTILSPWAAHARRKARAIHESVRNYEV